ncbi:MAG: hypothetical protein RIQ89_676 [Bacteroidota bacterium]|jgi:HPt (histidine-containing phosphotransfer) domain-containing protein
MHVDLSFLTSFTGGDKSKMKKYVLIFLDMYPSQMAKINTALSNVDLNGVRGLIHAIKPQFAYMGMKPAESLAKDLEQAATEGNEPLVTSLISELDSYVTIGITQLQEEIKNW